MDTNHPDFIAVAKVGDLKSLRITIPEQKEKDKEYEYSNFGGGWKKVNEKTGKERIALSFEMKGKKVYINMFPNKNKTEEKPPDFIMFMDRFSAEQFKIQTAEEREVIQLREEADAKREAEFSQPPVPAETEEQEKIRIINNDEYQNQKEINDFTMELWNRDILYELKEKVAALMNGKNERINNTKELDAFFWLYHQDIKRPTIAEATINTAIRVLNELEKNPDSHPAEYRNWCGCVQEIWITEYEEARPRYEKKSKSKAYNLKQNLPKTAKVGTAVKKNEMIEVKMFQVDFQDFHFKLLQNS